MVIPGAQVIPHPMADGGDGTLDVVLAAVGGKRVGIRAPGPLGNPLEAPVALLPGGSILIESARFCGRTALGGHAPDPMAASSYGLGVAIREALALHPRRLLVGLGGSVTIDGGLGMARALGFTLRSDDGETLEGSGRDLARLESIGQEAAIPITVPVVALADVANPLTGATGAARVFGPQKGASAAEIEVLERGLGRLEGILSRDIRAGAGPREGAGAAGGLGAALFAFLSARLVEGARAVAALTGLSSAVAACDGIVTGEGVYESAHEGKVVGEVARLCAGESRPLAIVCSAMRGTLPGGKVRVFTLGPDATEKGLLHAGKALADSAFWRD